MTTETLQHDAFPPAVQTDDRDERGRFAPGNAIGQRFTPGTSGNPTGRPAGVAFPGDFLRGLSCLTAPALRAVADDDTESAVKRAAALQLLDTLDGDAQIRSTAFSKLADRLEGRPHQSVEVKAEREPLKTPEQLLAEVRRAAGITPEQVARRKAAEERQALLVAGDPTTVRDEIVQLQARLAESKAGPVGDAPSEGSRAGGDVAGTT